MDLDGDDICNFMDRRPWLVDSVNTADKEHGATLAGHLGVFISCTNKFCKAKVQFNIGKYFKF